MPNETHPQDEYHPFYSDLKCTYCGHNVGVPCDAKGNNIDLQLGQVMFCINCCEVMEVNRERKLSRLPPRTFMQLTLTRPEEMLTLFMRLQLAAKHQDKPI